MPKYQEECAAMAAAMLDAELVAIVRKCHDNFRTPLQREVKREAQKRGLIRQPAEPIALIVFSQGQTA